MDALIEETEWEYQEVSSEVQVEPASNSFPCTQFERLITHSHAPTCVCAHAHIYTHIHTKPLGLNINQRQCPKQPD